MPAPTNFYTWDSNGTNSSAPTSGHQTDGWAIDEIPADSEINGVLANALQRIAWLEGSGSDQTITASRRGGVMRESWSAEVEHLRRIESMRCHQLDRADRTDDERLAAFAERDAAAFAWALSILDLTDYADSVDRARDLVAADRVRRGLPTRRA